MYQLFLKTPSKNIFVIFSGLYGLHFTDFKWIFQKLTLNLKTQKLVCLVCNGEKLPFKQLCSLTKFD